MSIGACGVCCSVCRLNISGACTGCAQGDECPIDKVIEFACPILHCASNRSIPFCVRDCTEYPCTLFQDRISICERSLVGEPQAILSQAISISTQGSFFDPRQESEKSRNHPSPPLYIYCLGPLCVFRNGKIITEAEWGQSKGPTWKIKALFAFLLAKGACGTTKDAIEELLWGDKYKVGKIEARFHAALYYLRRALEPDLPPRVESSFILYESGNYKLVTPEGSWIDAEAFEHYYQQALHLEKEGQGNAAVNFLKLAESLYQGDYMINLASRYTEEYIDDCCKLKRFLLREMYLMVLLKLATIYFVSGQDPLSMIYAQKALAQDRGCEEAYCLLLKLMHRAGQRYNLIRQYQLCELGLVETEDRSPSPETVQLYRQLLQTVQDQ